MDQIDFERLQQIRSDMIDLLDEAKTILRQSASKHAYERAKAYWIGHIDTGLGGGSYVDTYDHTFEKTLNELEYEVEGEDDEEYDEECEDEQSL